jgi:hypothetical protein
MATNQKQVFLKAGLGSHHYLWKSLSVIPEFEVRAYQENRSVDTGVFEWQLSLGAGWLFD